MVMMSLISRGMGSGYTKKKTKLDRGYCEKWLLDNENLVEDYLFKEFEPEDVDRFMSI